MTEPWVADFSWARPELALLRSQGCVGVMRYVGPGNRGRDVTGDEIARLHDAGLGVGVVWETTQTGALAGATAGAYDFAQANRWADVCGLPEWLPVFYAVDTDVTPAQVAGPVAATFHGELSAGAGRPCRPYGEADVLDILCGQLALMPCGWQCYAWSHGVRSTYRCLFQTFPPIWNETVDVNLLGPMPTDFLWHPTISYLPPAPTPGDEFDMATIDDLRTVIRDQLGWHLIVDGRPASLSAWLLNVDRMVKRWIPGPGSAPGVDFPRLFADGIHSGALPQLVDLGMRGAGDPWIGLLDLSDVVGPPPPSGA